MPDSLEKSISDAGSFLSEASTWIPEWLPNSAWIEHAPFAFWLIEAHEPEVLIELGTHMGYSFFAFCQAITRLKLSTRAYAVDTWKGDEHAGFYGEEVFQEVSAHNADRYSGFSQLIRSTFDDALPYFEDGSVDLLHIDGRHFYEDVKHDFNSWLPKLSDRGIVLLHDINVRERSFGVFRFWAELSQRYPHFQFFHGWGLGVLGVGKKLPRPLRAIFEIQGNTKQANKVRNIYARLGASLDDRSARRRSASEIGLKEAEASALKVQISTLEAHVANSRGAGEAALSELSDVRSRLLASEAHGAELEAALTMRTGELSAIKTEFAEKEGKAAQQRGELETALCETRQKLDSGQLQLAAAQAALTQQNEDAAQQRADLKSRLADGRQQLQSTAAQLAAARNDHQVALRDIRRDLASTMAQLDAAKAQLAESTAELARQRDDTVRQRAGLEAQRAASQERAVTAEALCERLRVEHDSVLTSSFWRATAPARRLVAILPQGVRRQARRGARLLYWALTPHRTTARIAHLRARRESIRKNNNPAWAALFDRDWYLERYPDVAAGADKGDPLRHFIHHGAAERRDPNPFFDTCWYLETNPDVARAGDNALAHYFEHGAAEGRDPSPLFDTSWYLEANSDVAEAGTNPLLHYLRHGAAEGRATRAAESPALLIPPGVAARISPADHETIGPIVAALEAQGAFNAGWYGNQPLEPRDRYRQVPISVAAFEQLVAEKYDRETRSIADAYLKHTEESRSDLPHGLTPNTRIETHLASVVPGLDVTHSSRNPTFSFVTPFFDHLVFFQQCVQSMANLIATFRAVDFSRRVEWVIGNNNPTISNRTLLEQLPEPLRSITIIIGDGINHGITKNLNRVISESNNEWLIFLDSDDLIISDTIATLTHYIRIFPKCRYISSGMIDIDESNKVLRYRRHLCPSTQLFTAGMVAGHLKAIRKDLFKEIGFLDDNFELAQDYEFALRAAEIEPLLLIPDYLYCYRWHRRTQSVSNLARQSLTRDRIRVSRMRHLAEQGILGGRIEPRNSCVSTDFTTIRRGACIIRTQGRRLELLNGTIASVKEQLLPLTPVVVVHGDEEIFRDTALWCHEVDSSTVCLHAPLPGLRRGYPANVGLEYVEDCADEFDFVCFLDDDDIFYPNFAERIAAALNFSGADVVYAEANRRVPWIAPEAGPRLLPPCALIGGNFITVNAFGLRVSCLLKTKVRFEDDMHYLEDWNFLVKLLGLGARFSPLFETLSEFRIFGDGNTTTKRFAEIYATCQQKMAAKCQHTAKVLGPGFFYSSIGEFDFSARAQLVQADIDLLRAAQSLFEVAQVPRVDELRASP